MTHMTIHTNQTRNESSTATGRPQMQQQNKYYSARTDSNLHGFIHHPPGFPIEYRPIKQRFRHNSKKSKEEGNIGLCFESDRYIKPGTLLEVDIPVRGEVQKFTGRVILVRNKGEIFEIGIWLGSKADGGRIRIVEQICHIEAYLKHKRHHEGPFVSPERVAQEWISRFAARFPSFG